MAPWLNFLITVVTAFCTAMITSIWAPWNTLRIDNARQLRKSREEKIARWRQFIASQEFQDMDAEDFLRNTAYLELRPYLNLQSRDAIEPSTEPRTLTIRVGGEIFWRTHVQRILLERVDELESEWQ
jgi:hypothetical protein